MMQDKNEVNHPDEPEKKDWVEPKMEVVQVENAFLHMGDPPIGGS
ncbi:hypothetical protein [Fibrella forsythiae]|nr:hypothetical protein [Fibrella forsythiae]